MASNTPASSQPPSFPPTGRPVTVHSISILRMKDDLIASEHVYFDQLEMLMQLGLKPAAPGPNDHSV